MRIKLDEILEKKNITKYRLSKITNISPNNLSNIEHNKISRISIEYIAKICVALDCTPNDLFEIEESDKELINKKEQD